jgi:hypothetical protein
MNRLLLLALVLLSLTVLLLARPAQEAGSRNSIENLASAIQTELDNHGDRVLGNGLYGWSTRLNRIEECRAELSVRVTDNTAEASVRTETVNFSLGAIEPYNIEMRKNFLTLPCSGKEKCIFSTSTCSTKTKDGIVTDCATSSQKRVDSLILEFDGDAAAAVRLERAFRGAVDLCRTPKSVAF